MLMHNTPVFLITGAAGTVGTAVTRYCVQRGYTPVLHVHQHAIDALLTEVSALSSLATQVCGDLTQDNDVNACIAHITEHYGRLDGIIHTLGDYVAAPLAALSTEDIRRVLDTNITSTLLLVREALPLLRAAHGRVILFGAAHTTTHETRSRSTLYAITKHAISTITQQLGNDHAAERVTFSCIAPTWIEGADFPLNTPTHTPVTIQDLTRTLDFLLDSPHTAVNGTTLTLSDGWLPSRVHML